MEALGPAPPTPTKEELIAQLAKPIAKVIAAEMADEADADRTFVLRKVWKNYSYYRDLAYFAPAMYQGLIEATGIDGSIGDTAGQAFDYTQNIYRGYCRKLEAVLGTRIPNVVFVPDNAADDLDVKSARAHNDAAQYIRESCELQVLILWMVFSLYNFGTSFWSINWIEDGDANGWKDIPQEGQEQIPLGGEDMGMEQFPVDVPQNLPPKRVPKGALCIEVLDASEVSVPLDADGRLGVKDCHRIRREREVHKSGLLEKYGDQVRSEARSDEASLDDQSASAQYGENVRSAMASPIGIVRPKRENRWTIIEEDWQPKMYQMFDDKATRDLVRENFPKGLRVTAVKGRVVDLEDLNPREHWQECQPEPTKRIMCDPLGDDWVITQDILNNLLNQCNEIVERANEPGFADPTRVDLDAYQRRRSEPAGLIPAVRPAGGTLADLIFRPPTVQFSEQIPPFRAAVEETSKETSGLTDVVWGGDTSDPTARQTELKTNAAIRQLSVIWVMIGKSLERVYEKACALLAEHEDGVLAFSKKNQFGKFDAVTVSIQDMKSGRCHAEADEAIPMTWGQQRDLLMWMLDKPPEILTAWGLNDPLNAYELKSLLGLPGMRVPNLDSRDKGMSVIGRLLEEEPKPGQPTPDGTAAPEEASIPPDWEDDSVFMAGLAKAYLTENFEVAQTKPRGYENVQLWGQAHDAKANAPGPKPPVRAAVSVSLKGADLGDPAVSAALQGAGVIPASVQTQTQLPPPKLNGVPAPPTEGAPPTQ